MLNYFEITLKKIEELTETEFLTPKNQNLKNMIIKSISEGKSKEELSLNLNEEHKQQIIEINKNSNIQMIAKNRNYQEILELFEELILEYKEQDNLKKIESLENKLINNLDENSFSELVKLKSQLNRE